MIGKPVAAVSSPLISRNKSPSKVQSPATVATVITSLILSPAAAFTTYSKFNGSAWLATKLVKLPPFCCIVTPKVRLVVTPEIL